MRESSELSPQIENAVPAAASNISMERRLLITVALGGILAPHIGNVSLGKCQP